MRRFTLGLCISLVTMAGAITSPIIASAATQPAPAPVQQVVSATACSSAFTVDAVAPYSPANGRTQGLLELRFNSCNRTIWARITTSIPYPCAPGDDYCGNAQIHRNSDGANRYCGTPSGTTSCYTAALGDANVTSYAYGTVDYGAYVFSARTINY